MRRKIQVFILLATTLTLAVLASSAFVNLSYEQPVPTLPTLDPLTIPKYVNQLVIPPVYVPTNITDKKGNLIRQDFTVDVTQFYQQILPTADALGNPTGFPMTKVWGYGGMAKDAVTEAPLGYVRHSPAATFEAIRGVPIKVKWVNNLGTKKYPLPHMFPVDPTLHWANPNNMMMPMPPFEPYPPGYPEAQTPVPIVTHLHGGEVPSAFDGGPDEWFTPNGIQGPGYSTYERTDRNAAVYYYPNKQLPTTLWYHDHALGITRINVMSGLAGFYLLREYDTTIDSIAPLLPKGKYEIPLAIQDRSFNTDGSMWVATAGVNPDIHPYWDPEFFGNTIMVNGRVWPNLYVEPRQYRFRVLDGSNARFYNLFFVDQTTMMNLPFTQIGSDGGYLPMPATLTALTIAPSERADILVDFSGLALGTKIILRNNAKAPFPGGAAADPQTVGQIMQFTVVSGSTTPPAALPTTLNTIPMLIPDARSRTLTLIEVMAALGPKMVLLDGQEWSAQISEMPQVGSTEDWYIINPTEDAHPIHLHLVQFQAISRQKFNVGNYLADWMALNGMPPFMGPTQNVLLANYLVGAPKPPEPNEMGWKDTNIMYPGEVTTIRVRFAPQNAVGAAPGVNLYPFNPTVGPGYVWHCHILEHEDNEMMRPYKVTP